jgi:LuxR family maltose regulon positive regulatory protein
MARTTPRVERSTLIGAAGDGSTIAIGTPAWYAWLEQATTFAFIGEQGSFTARKERRARAGGYWKAYRKQAGTLRSAYLGKSTDLTLDRLNAVALSLAPADTPPKREPDGGFVPSAAPAPNLPSGTVTFLFTDIEGSTQLWEQHPHVMPSALARHDAILRQAIESHGGAVFKTVGDSVHAVFARASDALVAGLAAQRALDIEPWGSSGPLRARMALHTGAAELRDGDYFGPPLNRVARIVALGHGGQILLSHAAHDLTADDLPDQTSLRALGEYQLKDLTRPELIFQLISPALRADFPPLRSVDRPPPSQPAQLSPLLATKLYAPPARPQLVVRSRLLARLIAGLRGKLTLVSAPAGFGKTTLLSAWRATAVGSAMPLAWVSLDASDSDPLRFWSYVITALEMIQADSGAAALTLLQTSQPPPVEAILTPLLNGLSTLTTDAVLVLDDYQLVDSQPIQSAVAFLLDHLPPLLHLVIITRVDPPLPLTRLRARGQLTELRAADLRFTAEETGIFLTELMDLPLSANDVAALEQRTEGWIAGLQLAALAMRDRSDLPGFIHAFAGSNRFVMDYLAEEVIDRLPHHLQIFVLQTSILDRMCGPLCDAVLGMTNDQDTADPSFVVRRSSFADSYSQLILDQLERANLFIVPLDDDRHWYRYHQLFADVVRARLRNGEGAETVTLLHRRASAWFEQHGLLVEAVQHALTAQDWERVARLIEQAGLVLFAHSSLHRIMQTWLEALPLTTIQARPKLGVLRAWALIDSDSFDAAERCLEQAEQALHSITLEEDAVNTRGEIAAARALLASMHGDTRQIIASAERALADLRATNLPARTSVLVSLGRAYLGQGDIVRARQACAEAAALGASSGHMHFALSAAYFLAYMQRVEGTLREAVETCRRAVQWASTHGAQMSLEMGIIQVGLADLLREQNDFTQTLHYVSEGANRARQWNDTYLAFLSQFVLVRIIQAQGDIAGALAVVQQARQFVQQRQDTWALADWAFALLRAVAAQLSLAEGNIPAAMRWIEEQGQDRNWSQHQSNPLLLVYAYEQIAIAPIQVLLAQGRLSRSSIPLNQAIELLAHQRNQAEQRGVRWLQIKTIALEALVYQALQDLPQALSLLQQALGLAAREGYVRIFVDEGAPMAALLREAHAQGIASGYVAKLMAAFPKRREAADLGQGDNGQASTLIEPLSDRELEVLRLIADGHSNQAIADRLVVAVSTVKKHVNNIYGKLDVQSRTQAVARGRKLRLL